MALPIKGRGPGVVVAQEIFGVTDSLKQVCDFLASRQFTAICPDLYWRSEEGVVLKENDYERARAMRAKTDDNQAAADLNATRERLVSTLDEFVSRSQPASSRICEVLRKLAPITSVG